MFQDEQATDSAERFLELLDLTVDAQSLELDLEHIPGKKMGFFQAFASKAALNYDK